MGFRDLVQRAVQVPYKRFDPNGVGYDYQTAMAGGARPGADQHWPSRDPVTGQILKGAAHPTFFKTIRGENQVGYEMSRGPDGFIYSQPRPMMRRR